MHHALAILALLIMIGTGLLQMGGLVPLGLALPIIILCFGGIIAVGIHEHGL